MVMSVFQIPFRISLILHDVNFCLGLSGCYVRQITDSIGHIGSMVNLFLISVDRYYYCCTTLQQFIADLR